MCLEEGRPAAGFVWVGYDPPLQPVAALFCCGVGRGKKKEGGGKGERKGRGRRGGGASRNSHSLGSSCISFRKRAVLFVKP